MRRIRPSVICLVLSYVFFSNYLLNGTTFGEKMLNINCVFWFYLQLLSETLLILRRIKLDILVNLHRYSCRVPVILVTLQWNLNRLDRFSKNLQISNFTKTHTVGAESFLANGRIDRKDQANTRLSQFCESSYKRLLASPYLSLRPSVRTVQLRSHWTDFHEICCLRIFRNFIEKSSILIKIWQEQPCFTWRPPYIHDTALLNSS
jgi:hypothetical protein